MALKSWKKNPLDTSPIEFSKVQSPPPVDIPSFKSLKYWSKYSLVWLTPSITCLLAFTFRCSISDLDWPFSGVQLDAVTYASAVAFFVSFFFSSSALWINSSHLFICCKFPITVLSSFTFLSNCLTEERCIRVVFAACSSNFLAISKNRWAPFGSSFLKAFWPSSRLNVAPPLRNCSLACMLPVIAIDLNSLNRGSSALALPMASFKPKAIFKAPLPATAPDISDMPISLAPCLIFFIIGWRALGSRKASIPPAKFRSFTSSLICWLVLVWRISSFNCLRSVTSLFASFSTTCCSAWYIFCNITSDLSASASFPSGLWIKAFLLDTIWTGLAFVSISFISIAESMVWSFIAASILDCAAIFL